MRTALLWLAALAICIGLSVVWNDDPSETDALRADQLALKDSQLAARAALRHQALAARKETQ